MSHIANIVQDMSKLDDGDIVPFGVDNDIIVPTHGGETCVQSVADVTFIPFDSEPTDTWWHLSVYDNECEESEYSAEFLDSDNTFPYGATHVILRGLAVSNVTGARVVFTTTLSSDEAADENMVDAKLEELKTVAEGACENDEVPNWSSTYGWSVAAFSSILGYWAKKHVGKNLHFVLDENYEHPFRRDALATSRQEFESGDVITVGVLDNGTEVVMGSSVLDRLMREAGETQAEVMQHIMEQFNSGAFLTDPSFRQAGSE